MAISSTPPVSSVSSMNSTAPASTVSAASAKDMSANFMQLLVAQLKNQDPLNPIDNAQMTSQMAQLNSLEQLTKISDLLAAQSGASHLSTLSEAASALGKTAELKLGSQGAVTTQNGEATVGYDFNGQTAFKSVLTATDPVSGTVLGSWELKEAAGEVKISGMPSGVLLSVSSTDATGQKVEAASGSQMLHQSFKVNQTVLTDGIVYLQSSNGIKAPWSDLVGLKEATAT